MLKVILVGFNEELNLRKFSSSIQILNQKIDKDNLRIYYIDQKSSDNSINIAKEIGCDIIEHPGYGYPEASRKIAYDLIIGDNDRGLFLDCDEELTQGFIEEMILCMESDSKVASIALNAKFLVTELSEAFQYRLFRKDGLEIIDSIHDYMILKSDKIFYFKNKIINNDLKDTGKYNFNMIKKLNNYTDKELQKFIGLSKFGIISRMIYMPWLRFFGWGIKEKCFSGDSVGEFIVYTCECISLLYMQNYMKKL